MGDIPVQLSPLTVDEEQLTVRPRSTSFCPLANLCPLSEANRSLHSRRQIDYRTSVRSVTSTTSAQSVLFRFQFEIVNKLGTQAESNSSTKEAGPTPDSIFKTISRVSVGWVTLRFDPFMISAC